MSYISTADTAALRTHVTASSHGSATRRIQVHGLPDGLKVGPALEVVLFLATSAVVTLFTCTGIASVLLK